MDTFANEKDNQREYIDIVKFSEKVNDFVESQKAYHDKSKLK